MKEIKIGKESDGSYTAYASEDDVIRCVGTGATESSALCDLRSQLWRVRQLIVEDIERRESQIVIFRCAIARSDDFSQLAKSADKEMKNE